MAALSWRPPLPCFAFDRLRVTYLARGPALDRRRMRLGGEPGV